MKLSPLAILFFAGLLSSGEAFIFPPFPKSPPGDAFMCYKRGSLNRARTEECCRKTQGKFYFLGERCHYGRDYKKLVSTGKIITAEECCDANYHAWTGKDKPTAENVTAH